ncbi:MAG: cytochrome b [Shinella sp.]|uniref:cytochrome b n=1 Tax=Shinella sp. TaxID=1870904 RepID=UPI00403627E6
MLRNTRTSYGTVAMVFHWTIALLFFGQIVLGYLTQALADDPRLQFDLYQWHKSFGFLVLVLALPRAAWSLSSVRPVPLASAPRWERAAARIVHLLLLTLTVAVPLAGWLIASTSPLRIPSFLFDLVVVPDLPLARSDAMEAFWSSTHALLAYGAGVLALAHASAAIYHHLVRGDAMLARIVGRRARVLHPRDRSR